MKGNKFSIENEYNENADEQSTDMAMNKKESDETVELSATQVADMKAYKDAGDFEGLGKYVSELI